MWEASSCFRCGKPMEGSEVREIGGNKVGRLVEVVRVHDKCNTSMFGELTYFFGPNSEERRAFGELTEEACEERRRIGM